MHDAEIRFEQYPAKLAERRIDQLSQSYLPGAHQVVQSTGHS